jgi:hypothetical protein
MVLERIDHAPPVTHYVSRVIDLPPVAAQDALDACQAAGSATEASAGRWTVRTERSRVVFEGTAHPGLRGRNSDLCPLRRWFGVLRSARGRPAFRIEIELAPWSSTSCELGIRPAGRWRRPGNLRQGAYFSLAGDVLESLGETLERTAWEGIVRSLSDHQESRVVADETQITLSRDRPASPPNPGM